MKSVCIAKHKMLLPHFELKGKARENQLAMYGGSAPLAMEEVL